MALLVLLVVIGLLLDHWLLAPLGTVLTPLLHGSWAPWALLLAGAWLLAGHQRQR
jgi:hypothetical protein